MREKSPTPLPSGMRATRRRLARLVVAAATLLTLFTLGPCLIRSGRPERANRPYGPMQRLTEWLHPGRREAPALVPPTAWRAVEVSVNRRDVHRNELSSFKLSVSNSPSISTALLRSCLRDSRYAN